MITRSLLVAAFLLSACAGGAPPNADEGAPSVATGAQSAVAPETSSTAAASAAPASVASAEPTAEDPVAMLHAAAKETSVDICREYFTALAECLPKVPKEDHPAMLNGFDAMRHKSRAGASAEELEFATGRCKVSLTIGMAQNEHCKK